MFGLHASDLQSGVLIENNAVSGVLNYVTGYTGYSTKVKEQKGNYLAISVSAPGAEEILVGTSASTMKKVGDDGVAVVRITNTSTQAVNVQVVKDGKMDGFDLDLSNLVLTPAP